ncbi:MAG: hypothetical protein K9H61_05455 [Bacteroidia bacterium]|nr:hypothetical protein [Bacteroidia bacterium]MCF8427229.1 hypothetical protein [Bacteroidia bacterium]MCF8446427.1 hypothetical protein [Bacteroidia bacterium]
MILKKVIFTAVLWCISFAFSFGQEKKHTKIVFAELLGASDIYSLNFDYGLTDNRTLIAGLSFIPGTWQLNGLNDRSFLYVPIMYHFLVGKKWLKGEISGGSLQTITFHKENRNLFKFRPQLGIGLRIQPKKGIFLRAGISIKLPLALSVDSYEAFIYKEPRTLIWPGIGFGYCFN